MKTQFVANVHTADNLFKNLISLGYPPEDIVYTGSGVFFTLICEKKHIESLQTFIEEF